MYLLSASHASKLASQFDYDYEAEDEFEEDEYEYDAADNANANADDRENKDPNRPRRRRKKFRLNQRSKRRALADRTQWGTYRELAPPILPSDAASPRDLDVMWYLKGLERRGQLAGEEECEPERGEDEEEDELEGEGENGEVEGDELERRVARAEKRASNERLITSRASLLRTWMPGRFTGFETSSWTSGASVTPIPGDSHSNGDFPTATTRSRTIRTNLDATSSNAAALRSASASATSGSIFSSLQAFLRRFTLANFSETRRTTVADMAVRTHWWITFWFLATTPVIMWDAMYLFMRPRSMRGGDLHWIWSPYSLYQDVDYIYGLPALNEGDGFPNAQSLLNLIETALNVFYVYKASIVGSPAAPIIGLVSATMTLSKTALYWLQEYYCNWCSIGHNKPMDLLLLWIIPNGLWLLVPSLIIWQLYSDISATLNFADKLTGPSGKAEKKKQ